MQSRLKAQLRDALTIQDEGIRYHFYFSLIRCILQASSTAAIDVSWQVADDDYRISLSEQAVKLLKPSDGDYLTVLDTTISLLRNCGWKGCVETWFDVPRHYAQERQQTKRTLRQVAENWVRMRNRRQAHGVVDAQTVRQGLDILPQIGENLLEGLRDLLPDTRKGGGSSDHSPLTLSTPLGRFPILSYELVDNEVILIQRYERRGSVWRFRYQVLNPMLSEENVAEISADVPLMRALVDQPSRLQSAQVYVGGKIWKPTFVLPRRQTDSFIGRQEELDELSEWWDDRDSRACLVYGEGGIGKTTLVLEFVHSLLEGPPTKLEWLPDLIFFYSAKETRWGIQGIEHLTGVLPSISDSVRELVKLLEPRLERKWFIEDERSLIDRAAELMQSVGIGRDDLLLILDNTETLARVRGVEPRLGRVLRQISVKLGRVVLTSRRKETFEARPIRVLPMDPEVGADLLIRLGESYEATPLLQAGRSRLRKLVKELAGKPLLLDVIARYISRSGASIEEGQRAILSHERGELGEFLFEDAWSRMSEEHQLVFLVVVQLGGATTGQVLGWTCSEFGVHLTDWQESFYETRFGSLIDYGTDFDISLESGAREFLNTKLEQLDVRTKKKVAQVAANVNKRQEDYLRAQSVDVSDRVVEAFRTAAAKAAKLAAARGDTDEAIVWYEEAVSEDPGNAALLDRFAWYLMVNRRLKRAATVARRAVETDPKDADAHFTAGMVAARLGKIDEADRLLGRAERLGKPEHLMKLQQAKARIEKLKLDDEPNARATLIRQAEVLLEMAVIKKANEPRSRKHMAELNRLRQQLAGFRKRYGIQRRRGKN